MKEEFLHYVWQYQLFHTLELYTTQGEAVRVLKPGQLNMDAGPDFFNAQVYIGKQLWAGNVEIHLKSSDWYAHQHHMDSNYSNVVLHVVWHHDVDVFHADESPLPVLAIKSYVLSSVFKQYQLLQNTPQKWIPCQNELAEVFKFTTDTWLERVYIERLETKAKVIEQDVIDTEAHWEAVLFRLLAKNFGLNVNGDAFYQMALSMPFSVVQKTRVNLLDLEALFLGQADLLDEEAVDTYQSDLNQRYQFLQHKYDLSPSLIHPKYFRLRPTNFPSIRLAQLAALYHLSANLFSDFIKLESAKDFYENYRVQASAYWDTHYTFGVESGNSKKRLSKNFMDLLLINTWMPLRFVYMKHRGEEDVESLFEFISGIKAESNTLVKNFAKYGLQAENAMQSQALIQLHKNYCSAHRCLSCAIGNAILTKEKK